MPYAYGLPSVKTGQQIYVGMPDCTVINNNNNKRLVTLAECTYRTVSYRSQSVSQCAAILAVDRNTGKGCPGPSVMNSAADNNQVACKLLAPTNFCRPSGSPPAPWPRPQVAPLPPGPPSGSPPAPWPANVGGDQP